MNELEAAARDLSRLYEAADDEVRRTVGAARAAAMIAAAHRLTLEGFGARVTYSRKVFVPLTRLCRDVCHYCTFATTPGKVDAAYLSLEQVVGIAQAGRDVGCREALFTLGDAPERRYGAARAALAALGHDTTLSYLGAAARAVIDATGLLPHLNPGLLAEADYAALRPVSASMGIMLETTAARLSEPGGPHHGSPDKLPARRLATIAAAGRARVPFTTGLLIGIGETRAERIDALLAIRALHQAHGHIQEVIIQNFVPKPRTRMASLPGAGLDEQAWTIAAARLILGPAMTIQAPPNLRALALLPALLDAGVNDWGGVSPVTPDHVNPEAPWPHLDRLTAATAATGRVLRERLAIGPVYARAPERWAALEIATAVRRAVDTDGLPVVDGWRPGTATAMAVALPAGRTLVSDRIDQVVARAAAGDRLSEADIIGLFAADGPDVTRIAAAADRLRAEVVGDTVSYVVNRNINYTNICLYKCGFCAFSKGSTRALRGPAYRLDMAEVARRAAEAQARGATEVCLQGGIHPDYDGETYLAVIAAVRDAAPGLHIHAFSPLEVTHGAATLGLSLETYLTRLRDAGLSTLPGTAAEILDDEVRALICPDKVDTAGWLEVMRTAHRVGLRSTATIMFGHVDRPEHWARHLLRVRDLQAETGGFTEFVPLPFVHMEAPLWRRGLARSGPSARETLLMHAVARLVLHPLIANIQASWVKLGRDGVVAVLDAGVNDLGGVLMDESITRAAGGANGQQCDAAEMAALAARAGRPVRQRTTLYGSPDPFPAHGDHHDRLLRVG